MERLVFTAIVTGEASQEFEKTFSNGSKGKFVNQNCKITNGKLEGLIVSAIRITKDENGNIKEVVPSGNEVQLFLTREPSKEDPSKMNNFFEINTGYSTIPQNTNISKQALPKKDTVKNPKDAEEKEANLDSKEVLGKAIYDIIEDKNMSLLDKILALAGILAVTLIVLLVILSVFKLIFGENSISTFLSNAFTEGLKILFFVSIGPIILKIINSID
ncbi:hypothetical protein KC678_03820 [Candidatus Dojkabacteria bacterium]|uniref:Uncharacterized protein n=1 Tax=Candidatus Dojkabacteria bacterium TaxID=2099670 RepID=A0A955L1U8_9BACT|nr:hypothetical protein [Candidatus Dojkabacteria bacterium]MCB0745881.1 hypothetical protein [Ignavibacteriota bacterium]